MENFDRQTECLFITIQLNAKVSGSSTNMCRIATVRLVLTNNLHIQNP